MRSALYAGTVRHRRHEPHMHEFSYRIFMMYVDLDELPDIFRGKWFWSIERANLATFRRRNYFNPSNPDLKQAILEKVFDVTGERPEGSVTLLTHFSYMGFCFNPVSFYFVRHKSGDLAAIVAEVANTPWNERHTYVVSPKNTAMTTKWANGNRIEAVFAKDFHVSPFLPMAMQYKWVITQLEKNLSIHMENMASGKRVFDATMVLERREISSWNLAQTLMFYPLMTFKVVSAIYWQALQLWIKRTPFFTHPKLKVQDQQVSRDH